MKTKTYLIKEIENGDWAVFRKRLFGYRRVTPGAFPTIYVAMDYISKIEPGIKVDVKVSN